MRKDLAVRGGWVKEGTEEVEEVFVNWNIPDQREIKSQKVSRSSVPNNATAYRGQKCQTSFVYRHDYCYIAGFTNFMPRFAIRTVCNLLDNEIRRHIQLTHIPAGKRDWYWDTSTYGTRAHFFFWLTGQPDITDNKNCVYAAYAGEWMTANCDNFRSPKMFVCQSEFCKPTLKFLISRFPGPFIQELEERSYMESLR
ncbi:unnamed protein product [Brugia pahangi]|uniref:C-type lectin domain-containing protein n=1 Tax=Brugia pahangi TaxID=6280 RepID=A0A0N4TRM3_BRUPA|nr:unnamed protein product [Brugia pahangi]